MADRDAAEDLARRPALHRPAPRRRREVWAPARQHGVGPIKTEKSGFAVSVTLPILPVLAATLAAGPCGDLTFIAGEGGQPLTKGSFGNLFRAACRAPASPGSAHGVRKIAATRAAENGATVAQLEAIFGWKGGKMASLYTESPIAGGWPSRLGQAGEQ